MSSANARTHSVFVSPQEMRRVCTCHLRIPARSQRFRLPAYVPVPLSFLPSTTPADNNTTFEADGTGLRGRFGARGQDRLALGRANGSPSGGICGPLCFRWGRAGSPALLQTLLGLQRVPSVTLYFIKETANGVGMDYGSGAWARRRRSKREKVGQL